MLTTREKAPWIVHSRSILEPKRSLPREGGRAHYERMDVIDAFVGIQTIGQIVQLLRNEDASRHSDILSLLFVRLETFYSLYDKRRRRDSIMTERWRNVLSIFVERALLAIQRHLRRMLGSVVWSQEDVTVELERISADLGEYLLEKTNFATAERLSQLPVLSQVEDGGVDINLIIKAVQLDIIIKGTRFVGFEVSARKDLRYTSPLLWTMPPNARHGHDILYPPSIQSAAEGHIKALKRLYADKSGEEQHEDLNDADGELDQRLIHLSKIPIRVCGVRREGHARDSILEETTIEVDPDSGLEEIKALLVAQGFMPPDEARLLGSINVTDNECQFDRLAPGGLQISRSTRIIDWQRRYQDFLGRNPFVIPNQTTAVLATKKDAVRVRDTLLSFRRAFRIPEGFKLEKFPDLGQYQLLPVNAVVNKERLPASVIQRGGLITCMYEREAMVITAHRLVFSEPAAFKIHIDGVNALNGCALQENTEFPRLAYTDTTSYREVVVSEIVMTDGKTRQIIHEPETSHNDSVPSEKRETRSSSPSSPTTIQIDLFPTYNDLQMQPINVLLDPYSYQRVYSLEDKPEGLQFPHGGRLYLGKAAKLASDGDNQSEALTVSGRGLLGDLILDVSYKEDRETEVARMNEMIRQVLERSTCAPMNPIGYDNVAACKAFREAASRSRRRQGIWKRLFGELTLRLPTLPSWEPSSEHRLNVPQNFTPKPAETYDEDNLSRIFVHILSPELWEDVVGTTPPLQPLTPDDYRRHNVPYFKLPGEREDGWTSKLFQSTLDYITATTLPSLVAGSSSHPEELPTICSVHGEKGQAIAVLRPCGHVACEVCLGRRDGGSSEVGIRCAVCGLGASKVVGIREPLSSDGRTSGVPEDDGFFTVLHRAEDDVRPLQPLRVVLVPRSEE